MNFEDDNVRLNMDHPLNHLLADAASSLTRKQFLRFVERMVRSSSVRWWLQKIGNIPACKRREVVRGLIGMFRQGWHSGYVAGFDACKRHERRRRKRLREAKDGQ